MKTWFTSDTHFDHEGLYQVGRRVRPFNCAEWGEMFLDSINSRVGRHDRLFILGDFAWPRRIGWWRQRIRTHVVLILGNHDKITKCRNVFGNNVHLTLDVRIKPHRIFLSHYPNAYWPGSHKGTMHLYGHCHDSREATLDAVWPQRRAMDVSPETARRLIGEWRPFSQDEIFERLLARKGHDLVEFYAEFQKHQRRANESHEHPSSTRADSGR